MIENSREANRHDQNLIIAVNILLNSEYKAKKIEEYIQKDNQENVFEESKIKNKENNNEKLFNEDEQKAIERSQIQFLQNLKSQKANRNNQLLNLEPLVRQQTMINKTLELQCDNKQLDIDLTAKLKEIKKNMKVLQSIVKNLIDGQSDHKCSYCGMMFFNTYQLNGHLKMHSMIKTSYRIQQIGMSNQYSELVEQQVDDENLKPDSNKKDMKFFEMSATKFTDFFDDDFRSPQKAYKQFPTDLEKTDKPSFQDDNNISFLPQIAQPIVFKPQKRKMTENEELSNYNQQSVVSTQMSPVDIILKRIKI